MAGSLLPLAKQIALTDAAAPGVGYKFHTYEPGTLTLKATYSDSALTTQNANPVVANARGEVTMYGSGLYRIILKDASDATVWDRDNVGDPDYSASGGSALIGFIGVGTGAVARTLQAKLRDIVSVKDKGAAGDGVADDTAEIDLAAAESDMLLFPDGTYVYAGNIDALFEKRLIGPGKIRYNGFDYAVDRQVRQNCFWMGWFSTWQSGHAFACKAYREHANCDGWTLARGGFATGVTMYQQDGAYSSSAVRIQRNSGDSNTGSAYFAAALSQRETRGMQGKTMNFSINGLKSSTYTGGGATLCIYYSEEPEQVIVNDDGTYTNEGVLLATLSLSLGETNRPRNAPFHVAATIPETAVQIAVVLEVPYVGTAGASDYVALQPLLVGEGEYPQIYEEPDHEHLLQLAMSRDQGSYSYGVSPGSATMVGSMSDVARNTNVNWAVAFNVRFLQDMAYTPTNYFYSTLDGQDFELHNHATSTSQNALAYDIGKAGVTITNNAAATLNARFSMQWKARSPL